MNSTACVIEANPDVSGIGIRISIYILCLGGTTVRYLLRVFSPGEDEEEFSRDVASVLNLQAHALLCTAIYQTIQGDITLFHAICAMNLLAILGTDLLSPVPGAAPRRWRGNFDIILYLLSTVAFFALNLYIWVTAPQFGSQPQCNKDTVYVIFGESSKVTSLTTRHGIILTLGLLTAILTLPFICMLLCRCIAYAREPVYQDHREPPKRLHGETVLTTIHMIMYFSVCIYLIASLEQTIYRNNLDPEETKWTFGQVIAIFLLLGVGNKLFNLLLVRWERRCVESLAADRSWEYHQTWFDR